MTETISEPIIKYVTKVEYVDREVEVIREVEKIVTVNQTVIRYLRPQPFPDLETLKEFISYWQANRVIVYESGDPYGACKWMAREIQREAARQGYDFPTETLTDDEMSILLHKRVDYYHRINKAWIPGVGEWYYDDNTEKLWQAW
ncbi:MAG: hypothetical protein PHY18_06610 [Dehalococcoidales bacterium]|nr:hypothetical protein [Dehalococcoidales bacterium]